MNKTIAVLVLALFASASAWAHAGHDDDAPEALSARSDGGSISYRTRRRRSRWRSTRRKACASSARRSSP